MLSATPNQSMRVDNKDGDVFADYANPVSITAVLVNDEASTIVPTVHRIVDGTSTPIPGLYVFRFDGTGLQFEDRVTILYRHTNGAGNPQDREVSDIVCARADVGRVVGV